MPLTAVGPVAVMGALLLVVWAVYAPGLGGPFLFDDLTSIVSNPFIVVRELSVDSLLLAARSGESGILGRPLAYLSFGLNYWAQQSLAPELFKATNVAIHVLNTVLVYRLARTVLGALDGYQSTRSAWHAPALAAALWAVHPLQLTSVLYVVQRMTSLSAFCVLLGLVVFVEARRQVQDHPGRSLAVMALGLFGGAALGVLAKENAILIVLYVAAIELWVMAPSDRAWVACGPLRAFYLCALVLPVVIALLILTSHPGLIFDAYSERSFGLLERLLTQGRVLFFYLGLLIVPRTGELSLVHDDFPVSTGFFEPWTTSVAALGWAVLGVLTLFALRAKSPGRLFGFALAWYLAGHGMESSFIALDLVHEHRNYLPVLGPLLAVSWYVTRAPYSWVRWTGLGIVMVLAATTWVRANVWASEDAMTRGWLRHHPTSARAHGLRVQFLLRVGADEAQTYAALADLARLDFRNITALSQMLLIVASKLPADRVVRSVGGEVAFLRAVPSNPANAAVRERALVARIEARLRDAPVGATTVRGLYESSGCISRGVPECRPLAPIFHRWFSIVLNEREIPPRYRAILSARLAELVRERDLALTVELLERARAIDPVNPQYAAALIRAHLARSHVARAEKVFRAACASSGAAGRTVLAPLRVEFAAAGRDAVGCP